MKFFKFSFLLLFCIQIVFAKSDFENFGDIFQIVLPVSSFLTTLLLKDYEGMKQFSESFAITQGTTYLLKYSIREKRPNSDNLDSFPSGHTSSSFSGASFIHKRYGFKYSILPYILSSLVGISRVESHWHYWNDVVFGAGIAVCYSFLFVKKYNNFRLIYNDGYILEYTKVF